MNPNLKKLALALATLLVALTLTTAANASCGDNSGQAPHRQPGKGPSSFQPASFLLDADDADTIVGMWHVTFTAEGNAGGPPDHTPIDNSIVTWHSDGTEIMNSGRPPQDGNFCMGVWKKTGRFKYKANHFAWGGNDTANAPGGIGNPAGPTRIVEDVTLSPDGNHYTGTFTLDAYDTSGNVSAHIVGVITATRITMDTTVNDLL